MMALSPYMSGENIAANKIVFTVSVTLSIPD